MQAHACIELAPTTKATFEREAPPASLSLPRSAGSTSSRMVSTSELSSGRATSVAAPELKARVKDLSSTKKTCGS